MVGGKEGEVVFPSEDEEMNEEFSSSKKKKGITQIFTIDDIPASQ